MNMPKKKIDKAWKKILQDDQDCDWVYIVKILQFKLKRTRKSILKNKVIVDAKEIGKQIKTVEKLLQKVIEDNYDSEQISHVEKRFGKRKLKLKFKKQEGSKNSIAIFTTNWDNYSEKKKEKVEKHYRKALKKAEKNRQNDLNQAMSLLALNLRNWWD